MIKMRYDNTARHGDIVMGDRGIATDHGLLTAIHCLLLSDATARANDPIPDGSTNRRGWWADVLQASGFEHGSRIWVAGTKATPQARRSIAGFAKDALRPLVQIGLAERIEVGSIVLRFQDVIAIEVRVLMPNTPAPQWVTYWAEVGI